MHPAETNGAHELYFLCDDLKAAMERLAEKGVHCSEVQEQRWGSITKIRLPGRRGKLEMYQPRHKTALRFGISARFVLTSRVQGQIDSVTHEDSTKVIARVPLGLPWFALVLLLTIKPSGLLRQQRFRWKLTCCLGGPERWWWLERRRLIPDQRPVVARSIVG